MEVPVNSPITATLRAPATDTTDFGARVEWPVTRAIASYWRPAELVGMDWVVTLDQVVQGGDYQLVWLNGFDPPPTEIFIPLRVSTTADMTGNGDFPVVDKDAVRPTVDDVANLERTRTFTEDGTELPTWTEETRPPDEEVEQLIDQALPIVLAELPPAFPVDFYEATKFLIALYVAILVEGSYFREQGPAPQPALWQELYDNALAGLKKNIDDTLAQWRSLKRIEIPPLEWAGTPHQGVPPFG